MLYAKICYAQYFYSGEEARERLARLTALRYLSLNCHFDEDQVKAVLPELVICSVSPRETWKDNAHMMVPMEAGKEMPCCPYVPPKTSPQKEKIHRRYTDEG